MSQVNLDNIRYNQNKQKRYILFVKSAVAAKILSYKIR